MSLDLAFAFVLIAYTRQAAPLVISAEVVERANGRGYDGFIYQAIADHLVYVGGNPTGLQVNRRSLNS